MPESRLSNALKWKFTDQGAADIAVLKEKDNVRVRRYCKQRRQTDKPFAILASLRCRVYAAVRAKRVGKYHPTLKLLGCSIPQLMEHISARFTEGMTWQNYGEWHIDHIRPCKMFDLTIRREQLACFNWTNLQPLWALDNFRKGGRF